MWLLTFETMFQEGTEELRLFSARRADLVELRREWCEDRVAGRAHHRRNRLFDPTSGDDLAICASANLSPGGEMTDSHRPFTCKASDERDTQALSDCLNNFRKLRKLRLEVQVDSGCYGCYDLLSDLGWCLDLGV